MSLRLTMTSPRRATDDELDQFEALVLSGGAVKAEGLAERVDRAILLVIVHDEVGPAGCCALKAPGVDYAERLGVPGYVEFGWLVVRPDLRRRGLAATLRGLTLGLVPPSVPLFCTRRTEVGDRGLPGFTRRAELDGGRLTLWARPPAPQGGPGGGPPGGEDRGRAAEPEWGALDGVRGASDDTGNQDQAIGPGGAR